VPTPATREDGRVTRLEIPVPGATLVADLHQPVVAPRAMFVISHGWGSQRPADIPAALAREGFAALAYDLRGHGESKGELDSIKGQDWVEDLVAVIDHAHHLIPHIPVALVGASFGAWLSVLASTQRPVVALSLRVPTNLPDAALELSVAELADSPAFRNRKPGPLGPTDTKALAAVHAFAGPIQIVDADLDAIIPPQTIANYLAAVLDPDLLTRHTLQNAPHHLATPALRAEYVEALISWATRVA
jgi:pimeloyl-ACP methyl ester carboxylesterase